MWLERDGLGACLSHILIVDEDRDLQRVLGDSLEQAGFEVVSALDGEAALRAVTRERFDLILLDLMLPDMPGTEVCRRLKQAPQTAAIPVVIVTGLGKEMDRVVGFELGADDYVVKPFSVRELILRVRAVLRRVQGPPEIEERFTFGKIEVDRAGHRVWVEGEEVVFTALELRILVMLHDHRGRVRSPAICSSATCGGRPSTSPRATWTPTSSACA